MTQKTKKTITKEKKISFSEGLKIVQSIQKKIEELNKTKASSTSPHEYSF